MLGGWFYSPSPEYPALVEAKWRSRFTGAAGMKGKVNRAVARKSEGGFGYGAIPL